MIQAQTSPGGYIAVNSTTVYCISTTEQTSSKLSLKITGNGPGMILVRVRNPQ